MCTPQDCTFLMVKVRKTFLRPSSCDICLGKSQGYKTAYIAILNGQTLTEHVFLKMISFTTRIRDRNVFCVPPSDSTHTSQKQNSWIIPKFMSTRDRHHGTAADGNAPLLLSLTQVAATLTSWQLAVWDRHQSTPGGVSMSWAGAQPCPDGIRTAKVHVPLSVPHCSI
jgi:hypothetical protein